MKITFEKVLSLIPLVLAGAFGVYMFISLFTNLINNTPDFESQVEYHNKMVKMCIQDGTYKFVADLPVECLRYFTK